MVPDMLEWLSDHDQMAAPMEFIESGPNGPPAALGGPPNPTYGPYTCKDSLHGQDTRCG